MDLTGPSSHHIFFSYDFLLWWKLYVTKRETLLCSALSSIWLWSFWILRETAKMINRNQDLVGLDELNNNLFLTY